MKFILRSLLLLFILVSLAGMSIAKDNKIKETATGKDTQVTSINAEDKKSELSDKQLIKHRKKAIKSFEKCKKLNAKRDKQLKKLNVNKKRLETKQEQLELLKHTTINNSNQNAKSEQTIKEQEKEE